jgi:hypothetical protein
MQKTLLAVVLLVGVVAAALADEPAAPAKDKAKPDEKASEVKTMSGMSVLGNQEAPTSLVIVPWKSSEMGSGIGVSKSLDTKIRPVDRDVFVRELRYYHIRSGSSK